METIQLRNLYVKKISKTLNSLNNKINLLNEIDNQLFNNMQFGGSKQTETGEVEESGIESDGTENINTQDTNDDCTKQGNKIIGIIKTINSRLIVIKNNLQNKIKKLEEEVEKCKKDPKHTHEDVEKLNGEIKKLQEELRKCNNCNKSMKDQLTKIQTDLESLGQPLADIENEVEIKNEVANEQ